MNTVTWIGLAVNLALFGLLVYTLISCRRRPAAAFPRLSYGGQEITPAGVKRLWTWVLVLSFLFGGMNTQDLYVQTRTGPGAAPLPAGVFQIRTELPFVTYEITRSTDEDSDLIYQESGVRAPLLFLLAAFLYHRWVRRWSPRADAASARTPKGG